MQLGVLFGKGAYLRDPWNILDALCMLTTLISVAVENRWPLLHVFRVFRALRLAQSAPGLRVSRRRKTWRRQKLSAAEAVPNSTFFSWTTQSESHGKNMF